MHNRCGDCTQNCPNLPAVAPSSSGWVWPSALPVPPGFRGAWLGSPIAWRATMPACSMRPNGVKQYPSSPSLDSLQSTEASVTQKRQRTTANKTCATMGMQALLEQRYTTNEPVHEWMHERLPSSNRSRMYLVHVLIKCFLLCFRAASSSNSAILHHHQGVSHIWSTYEYTNQRRVLTSWLHVLEGKRARVHCLTAGLPDMLVQVEFLGVGVRLAQQLHQRQVPVDDKLQWLAFAVRRVDHEEGEVRAVVHSAADVRQLRTMQLRSARVPRVPRNRHQKGSEPFPQLQGSACSGMPRVLLAWWGPGPSWGDAGTRPPDWHHRQVHSLQIHLLLAAALARWAPRGLVLSLRRPLLCQPRGSNRVARNRCVRCGCCALCALVNDALGSSIEFKRIASRVPAFWAAPGPVAQ